MSWEVPENENRRDILDGSTTSSGNSSLDRNLRMRNSLPISNVADANAIDYNI